MKKRVMVYRRFERFWHWAQAFLVIGLALTGFDIHFSEFSIWTFERAVELHSMFAFAFVILVVFAIFWHFTTGEWKQYLPTGKNLKDQVRFYLTGIFKNAPHPTKKTLLTKLNPLQRLAYLGLKVLVIPVLVTSGMLYYYYNNLEGWTLAPIAYVHTFAAFAMVAFMIGHIYLTTTGHSVFSNLHAMVTGYEELEESEGG